ncbi:MAG: dihydroorotate dehydrogenase electron transfer subunit [Eggerthellaceae bacterium]
MVYNENAQIVSHEKRGPRLYLLKLSAPQVARTLKPGQFIHMTVPHMPDHILRRPFSVYDLDLEEGTIDILYQVVGYGTDKMTNLQVGETVNLLGPIGNPWTIPHGAQRALVVGGGVGAASTFLQTKALIENGLAVDVILGAQTKLALVTYDHYVNLNPQTILASTDDGSFGFHGFATPLVDKALEDALEAGKAYDMVYVCGPEPLMRIVAQSVEAKGMSCQVSMERRMACGIGACLSCVIDTTDGKKRACVDGPIFDAKEVVWA